MGKLRVVGLDLSLTSTGMSDGHSVRAVQTHPKGLLEARMHAILCEVVNFTCSPSHRTDGHPEGKPADLAVIEGAAFGARGNAVDQLAGLRMLIRHRLYCVGIPFAVVPPSTLKMYTTGYGGASKAQMVSALAIRHGLDLSPHKVAHGKYDMADAYALSAMGYAHIGQPLKTFGPPAPLKSLLAVEWPDLPTT